MAKKERPEARNDGRYTPDCSENIKEAYCGICNTKMKVTRGEYGPRTMVGAMAGIKDSYDLFICPHRAKDWHSQAKAIVKLGRDTPSKSLEKMLLKEVKQLVKTKKATKVVHDWI